MNFLALVLAASPAIGPAEVLKADGSLTLTDNASYFVFKADGTFRSFPVGMSGRTFEGTWQEEGGLQRVEVLAKQGWLNGVSALDEYRRIVFTIYSGQRRAVVGQGVKVVFDGYFIIDELVKVPAPVTKVAKPRTAGDAPAIELTDEVAQAKAHVQKNKVDVSRAYLQRASFDTVKREWAITWATANAKGGQTFIAVPEAGAITVKYGE